MTILEFFGRTTIGTGKRIKTEREIQQKDEEEYYKIVDECADERKNFEIPNDADEHASYVLKKIFGNAEDVVCIFTDKLNGVVFNDKDLIEEAVNFLGRTQARLKIAYSDLDLTKGDVLSGDFLRNILNDTSIKGEVEIWNASKVQFSIKRHFCLNDGFEFRVENEHERAVANFGDKKRGQKLFFSFFEIIEMSKRVL